MTYGLKENHFSSEKQEIVLIHKEALSIWRKSLTVSTLGAAIVGGFAIYEGENLTQVFIYSLSTFLLTLLAVRLIFFWLFRNGFVVNENQIMAAIALHWHPVRIPWSDVESIELGLNLYGNSLAPIDRLLLVKTKNGKTARFDIPSISEHEFPRFITILSEIAENNKVPFKYQ